MGVKHLGPDYAFESSHREERYGGDINFYVRWEKHLIYACPSAYRVPVSMTFEDFLENVLRPDYFQHPDVKSLDFTKCLWWMDKELWEPVFDSTIEGNGISHMAFLQFDSRGLEGMHGAGN